MKKQMHSLSAFNRNGFTLVELLVALVVTSVILGAVATLAYAVEAANDVGDDTTQKQAQVRYATLRISELIRHCRLICSTAGDDLAVWRADDNGDGQVNDNELVYIEAGASRNYLRLLEFPSGTSTSVPLGQIQDGTAKANLIASYGGRQTILLPECSELQFLVDSAVPGTRFVSISFKLTENDIVRQYQINATLRSWAGHLLDGSGNLVSVDDDEG